LFLHEDGIKEVRTSRSKDQLTTAKEEISSLSEGIDEGMFDSKPAESNCRRCPYRSICADSVV
ncbi:MAG: PD-(D/E)XK nuclease family protein, partial [Candidatus Peribacteraceae bacterium]|nr:PD-(D/E)XK nuclease family protein [Candidatus Peribacteraceae bacterium]